MSNKRPKIVFVDDEPNILQALKRKIRNESGNWQAVFYQDSRLAKAEILSGGTDVVVTDVRMPGLNGLDLIRDVQAAMGSKSPQFVVVTGEGDTTLRKKALDLDAADLLNKPVNREDLLARIRNAIRLQQNKNALQQKNELLETQLIELQKMDIVGMMASGVAHDFNNILTVIMNYLQMIELRFDESSDFVREIERVRHAAVRGQQITGQMLKFIRQQSIGMHAIDLVQLINEALPILQMVLPKAAKLEWQAPETELLVRGEYGQLFQVLMNLVVNAANHIASNGRVYISAGVESVQTEIVFAGRKFAPAEYIFFSVTDNGPGLSEDFIHTFLEQPQIKRQSSAGSGLGLSIVSRCTLQHQGFLTVNNKSGQGAEFKVYLPVHKGTVIEKSTVC